MKKLIVVLFPYLFLLGACNNNSDDYIPEEEEEEKKEEIITEWDPSLLFVEENPEVKDQLLGCWDMIYDGWGIQPGIKDKNDYSSIRAVKFAKNGDYLYNTYPDQFVYHTYKITDDYLYFYSVNYNEEDGLNRGAGVWIYHYEFYDDKFRLKIAWGVLASEGDEYIFKRVKEEINY